MTTQVDHGTLFELVLAANDVDIKGLIDVTCKTVANMIKGQVVFGYRTAAVFSRTLNLQFPSHCIVSKYFHTTLLTVACTGKTHEEVLQTFNIQNRVTPSEEEQVRKEKE